MFEQYAGFLHQQYPHLSIVGDNYPPPLVNQYLAGFISICKMALILLIIMGDRVQLFESFNIQPPDIYLWAKQNKVKYYSVQPSSLVALHLNAPYLLFYSV